MWGRAGTQCKEECGDAEETQGLRLGRSKRSAAPDEEGANNGARGKRATGWETGPDGRGGAHLNGE